MRTRTDGVLRAMNGGKRVRTVRAVRLRYVRVRIRVATVGAAGAERDRSAGGSDLHLDDGIHYRKTHICRVSGSLPSAES